MLDAALVKDPSDLTGNLTLLSECDETLHLTAPRKFGFDFHWLREVGLGTLQGDLGLRIDAAAEASMQVTLTGHFRREISLDDQGWLRLEVFKWSDRGFNFASRISVAGQAHPPQPETLDELAAAIVGVHEEQWLKELPQIIEKANGKVKTVLPGIAAEALGRFLGRWDGLEPEVAAELWKIAGSLASYCRPEETRQFPEKVAGAAAQLAEDDLVEVLAQLRNYAQRQLVPAGLEHGLKS